jgi:hypothetical protein
MLHVSVLHIMIFCQTLKFPTYKRNNINNKRVFLTFGIMFLKIDTVLFLFCRGLRITEKGRI